MAAFCSAVGEVGHIFNHNDGESCSWVMRLGTVLMMAQAASVDEYNDINRFGLSEVYPRTNTPANVDIVFVHGLNGDPHKTWTSAHTRVFWPAQLLPPLLEAENARVLVYGYDSEVTSFTDGVSKDKIHNHAELLVAALAANRRVSHTSWQGSAPFDRAESI